MSYVSCMHHRLWQCNYTVFVLVCGRRFRGNACLLGKLGQQGTVNFKRFPSTNSSSGSSEI